MKWNVWKADVAADLHSEVRPKYIILHPMRIELVLSIDDNAHKQLKGDSKFVKQIEDKCDKSTKEALNKMKSIFRHADQQAAGFTSDASMASLFLRPIHMELEKYFDDACDDIQKGVQALLEAKRKTEDTLKKSSMKVGLDLKFDGIEIPMKNKKAPPSGGSVKLPPLEVNLSGIKLDHLKKLTDQLVVMGGQIKQALEKIKTGAGQEGSDEAATEAATKLIQAHTSQMTKVAEEWKHLSRPLKDAGHLLAEWKKDLGGEKFKVEPEKKAAVEKATRWAGWPRIQRTESQITLALKTLASTKKYGEAQSMAAEGNTSWTAAVTSAANADKELGAAVQALAKELKAGGSELNQIAKAISRK